MLRPDAQRMKRQALLAVVPAIVFVAIAALVVRAWFGSRLERERRYVPHHMKDILISFAAYEDSQGRLPPPVIRDSSGAALYSWRLALVHLVGPGTQAVAFFPTRAWTAPEHAELRAIPHALVYGYETPGANARGAKILAVTGEGTLFSGESTRLSENLPGDLIILVENRNSRIHWMSPGDLDVADLRDRRNLHAGEVLGKTVQDDFFVAFADGSVWRLSGRVTIATLVQFMTVAGAKEFRREAELEPFRIE